MNLLRSFATTAAFAAASLALNAASPLQPLRAKCTISASDHPGKFRLRIDKEACDGDRCGSNFTNDNFSRLTGITIAELAEEGAQLTATLHAEAGTFTCSGAVHDGSFSGDSIFTPDAAFATRMEEMGFSGLDSEKAQAYAFVNVESEWARSLKQMGVSGITTENLIALRIFNVDEAYIRAITALGYALPSADMLIALRVQGVDPAEVREIRALGYQPTLDELIQIRIFHITPEFIRRMRARDLKDLTIAKLVQIRIFNLAE
jgi:hypothetical protein